MIHGRYALCYIYIYICTFCRHVRFDNWATGSAPRWRDFLLFLIDSGGKRNGGKAAHGRRLDDGEISHRPKKRDDSRRRPPYYLTK